MNDGLNELLEKLKNIERVGNNVAGHEEAENILCEALRQLGANALADQFLHMRDKMNFWYE